MVSHRSEAEPGGGLSQTTIEQNIRSTKDIEPVLDVEIIFRANVLIDGFAVGMGGSRNRAHRLIETVQIY